MDSLLTWQCDTAGMKADSNQSQWANSPVANLVRYVPSGIYFARARVSGKLIRRSMTKRFLSDRSEQSLWVNGIRGR